MPRCIVKACETKQVRTRPLGDISMHTFPKAPERVKLWLEKTGQYSGDLDLIVEQFSEKKKGGNLRMCSKHFTPDCYETIGVSKRLKKDAIPSIFHGTGTVVQSRPFKVSPATSHQQRGVVHLDSTLKVLPANILPVHSEKGIGGLPRPAKKMFDSCIAEITVDGTYITRDTSAVRFIKKTTTERLIPCKDVGTWTGSYEDFVAERTSVGIDMSTSSNFTVQSKQSNSKTSPMVISDNDNVQDQTLIDTSSTISPDLDTGANVPEKNVNTSPISPDPNTGANVFEENVYSCSDPQPVSLEPSDNVYYQHDVPSYLQETDSFIRGHSCSSGYQRGNPFEERKFIVFESNLDDLLCKMKCSYNGTCFAPIIRAKKYIFGTMLIVYGDCLNGHNTKLWQNQPVIGNMPIGNLLLCAALLFSGNIYNKLKEFFKLLCIPFISLKTYGSYQKKFLLPAIDHRWKKERQGIIHSLRGKPLCLSGDGQHDQTDFPTQCCTYTLTEERTKKIIDFHTVHASEKKSMATLESKAFRRCVNNVLTEGLEILIIATKNKARIKKIMDEEFKQINHQFEIGQYTESLQKKLISLANKPCSTAIAPWIPTIINHLLVASALCKGDADLLQEKWNSVMYHVTNQHSWVKGTSVHKCPHDDLNKEEDTKHPWLKMGTMATSELSLFVHDEQIQQDLTHLTEFCNAGDTDLFHSMLLKYRPKGAHFTLKSLEARTKLAILAHNVNVDRFPVKKQLGFSGRGSFDSLQQKLFPKDQKQGQVEPIDMSMTIDHVYPIMDNVLRLAYGKRLHD
ncbi:uncharacterized protein LOC128646060 [Bombina bombina]|uniref:uncharacterized protein LOC128646060 n=1 Tax=Bombina bombina TaxID=8345 RepID=UPI00235AC407|nr:uncharacterized protein LOC128646060 [Bombina bombina]XP_053555459.1 uncharacterized protein LOC128646060 [Bombina bombina]